MADKPVYEQVEELTRRWNPPPTDHMIERVVGIPTSPEDGRATAHMPMSELGGPVQPDGYDDDGAFDDDLDDEEEDEGGDGYDDMTNAELQSLLEGRGLTKSGNKDELIARLREDDDDDGDSDDEE